MSEQQSAISKNSAVSIGLVIILMGSMFMLGGKDARTEAQFQILNDRVMRIETRLTKLEAKK